MRSSGLEPRIDTAGNIYGTRAGTDPTLKPIFFGSHIDSVPSGGNFDGDVGSMSAIEVMRTLKERGVTTRHPLEMVIWSNEEGGLVGSKAAAGELQPDDLHRVFGGIIMAEGDYVMVHSRYSMADGAELIIIDIVRMKDGIFEEHWDVSELARTEAESKSKRPMFGDKFPARSWYESPAKDAW